MKATPRRVPSRLVTGKTGKLELTSTTNRDATIVISDHQYAVELIATDTRRNHYVVLTLEAEQLDALAAEILRIREEHSI